MSALHEQPFRDFLGLVPVSDAARAWLSKLEAAIALLPNADDMRGIDSLAADYADVVQEVLAFLDERARAARAAGIAAERIVLDPGIGFAKLPKHNLALLARQHELLQAGLPLLVGWSRKSTLGELTGRAIGDRLAASIAAALAAVQRGASIVRVHDVAPTVDALRVFAAAGLTAQNVSPTPSRPASPGP